MKTKNLFIGATLFAAVSLTSSAYAGIITVADVTASSTFGTYNANSLIDESGLSGGLHLGDWQNKWLSEARPSTVGSPAPTLIFNLGSVFDVSSSTIWNYGDGCCGLDRSAKNLIVEASLDNINYFSVISSAVLGQPAGDPFPGETLTLNTTAQYIKFILDTNYGAVYTGLSEVQFDGTAVSPTPAPTPSIPEPSSIALIGLGLMGLGFKFAKKRKPA